MVAGCEVISSIALTPISSNLPPENEGLKNIHASHKTFQKQRITLF